jgi:hypothetical protein
MTKKVIYEKKEKTRILVPEVRAITEKYIEDVPRTVWDCDYCNRGAGDELPSCFGCGKHVCYFCLNKVFTEHEFETGEAGYDGDNISIPESSDYGFERIRLCPECEKLPPTKLLTLMGKIRVLDDVLALEKSSINEIIDEIERIRMKI